MRAVSGTASGSRRVGAARSLLPGLVLSLAAAGLAVAVGRLWPMVSPMLVAIVLGILATNLARLPTATAPGIAFAARTLLRVGIVLLGLQLVLADILALGAPMLVVVVAVVAGGLGGTVVLGRVLGVPPRLSLLVACGFSICGAAAVVGAAGVLGDDEETERDAVTAVALVVVFGTLMIPLVPAAATLLGLAPEAAALWAGGSIHEIAQVVAVGGILGGALGVAVVVKLARVLLLAPVIAVLGVLRRRAAGTPDRPGSARRRPPIVPLFVVGFLATVALRSALPLPDAALSATRVLQTVLLAAAMFGLGCGVKVRSLMAVGLRPFALAALATVLVASIAYAGVVLVT